MNEKKALLRYLYLLCLGMALSIWCGPALAIAATPENEWTGSGPFASGTGNRVINALAVDPTNPNIIYAGTGSGTVFQYLQVPPSVTTNAASVVTTNSATLNATVNAHNADTTVTFEYGLDASYGTPINGTPATVTGTLDTSVSANITGLTPGLTYHYRVVGVNSAGTSYGDDAYFTALKLEQIITFGPLSGRVYGESFTVSATGGDSGNPVTFSIVSGPATATGTNGSTITITGTGSVTVRASQAGSATYNPAIDVDQTFTVNSANTATAVSLTSGTNPSAYGQTVTFTATASAVAPASGTPTGTVTFKDGATTLGTVTLSGGTASFSTSTLSVGGHTITAVYSGDTNFGGSSGTISHTISTAQTVTILAATGNGYITLETTTPGCGFSYVRTKTADQAYMPDPLKYKYPYGLVEFRLNCSAAGVSAVVSITFPGNISGMVYRKCGPKVPGDNSTIAWYTFNNVTISRKTATLHFIEGKFGDDTGPDAVIFDDGGPGQSQEEPVPIPTMTEWGMIIFIILAGLGAASHFRRQGKA